MRSEPQHEPQRAVHSFDRLRVQPAEPPAEKADRDGQRLIALGPSVARESRRTSEDLNQKRRLEFRGPCSARQRDDNDRSRAREAIDLNDNDGMRPSNHRATNVGQCGDVDVATPQAIVSRLPTDPYHSSFAISSAAIGR